MKKSLLMFVALSVVAWAGLSSCTGTTDKAATAETAAPTEKNVAADGAQPVAQAEKKNEAEENESGTHEAKAKLTGKVAPVADAKTTTVNNLIAAFKGETTASAKYAAYSKKAQEEGYTQIALLFKAASLSEKTHAANHKSVLEDMGATAPEIKPEYTVKTTRENLQDAIAGESYEISTMYPQFLTEANGAGSQLALISLNYAYKTEQRHKPLYEKALAALDAKQVGSLSLEYYVCPTCGNTYDAAPPKRCGISMTSNERFVKVKSA